MTTETQTTGAADGAGTRAALPLDFELLDEAEQPALSSRTAHGQVMNLYVRNRSAGDVTLSRAQGPTPAEQCHVRMLFRRGTLKNLGSIALKAVDQAGVGGWSLGTQAASGDERSDEVRITGPAGTVIPRGKLLVLTLEGVPADGSRGTHNTRVEFVYQNMTVKGGPLAGRRLRTLAVVNQYPPKRPRIPVRVGFDGTDRVLAGPPAGTGSQLLVRVTNASKKEAVDPTLTFTREHSRIVLALPAGDLPDDLIRKDQTTTLRVSVSKSPDKDAEPWDPVSQPTADEIRPEWVFQPPDRTSLGPGHSLWLRIGARPDSTPESTPHGISASLPPGPTELSVTLQGVPDPAGGSYADEEYPLTAHKAPLVYADTRVGIGTTAPGSLLDVAGLVTVRDSLTVDKDLTLGEKLTIGRVEDGWMGWVLENGDRLPNAGYIRFGDNTGWNLHIGRRFEQSAASLDPENTGTSGVFVTILDQGRVGVGTSDPRTRLDVANDARTGDHTQVGAMSLYVTGDFGEQSNGVEFRHSNGLQGIGFGYNTIYATGSYNAQSLALKPMPAGRVVVKGGLTVDEDLRFGSRTAQHITLWETASGERRYGIGVQDSSLYFRSGKNFAWYKGGGHADGQLDAGGGQRLMVLDGGGRLTIGPDRWHGMVLECGEASPNAAYIRFGDATGWKLHIGRRYEHSAATVAPEDPDNPENTGTNGALVTIRDSSWDREPILEVHGPFKATNMWAPSDARSKTRIDDLRHGLAEVLKLRPVAFNWRNSADGEKSLGLIAQEVQPHIPEVVQGDAGSADGRLTLSYVGLIPVLIRAIQQVEARLATVEQGAGAT
jgi:hypothetical protein